MKELCSNDVFDKIKERPSDANKGNFGKLLIVSGSSSYRGAAYLSAIGALRCGAGIVRLASTEKVIASVSSRIAECTYLPLPESTDGSIDSAGLVTLCSTSHGCTAVLAGCGMGLFEDTGKIIYGLIENCGVPLILDADALNSVKDDPGILARAAKTPIITPHVGEFARLCGKDITEISKEPFGYAVEFAEKYGCTVILKSHFTVIASPGTEPVVSRFGNVGLAKGGSGDLLAGMTASFRAQGYSAHDSAECGVYVHGRAADICAGQMSYTSMLPSDVADRIDCVFRENGR